MSSKFSGILIFFVLMLFFVPNWILSMPEVQKDLENKISTAMDANVTLKSAVWQWYPMPHIGFEDFQASGREFSLKSPLLAVFPAWMEMFRGKLRIRGIVLHDPDFLLLSVPARKKKTELPLNWIRVTNGRFRVSPGLKFQILPLKNKEPHLTGIYGRLELDGDELSGRVSGKTRFAQHVSAEFFYNLETLEFSINSRLDHLDLARLYYKNITTQAQFPAEGFIDIRLKASGKALEYVKGNLAASSECLISRTSRPGGLFSCGTLSLFFDYRSDDLKIDLRSLEFVQPKMKLAGRIRFKGQKGHEHLLIDLKGQDIAVGQVRKSVLSLFKGEKLAREVCDIVRGGHARTLSFYFDDDPRYLESLHCMLIKGDLESVPVYVPDKDLYLDSVSGSMKIEHAILRLEDAKVKLRNSVGTDGLLVYGLADHQHELELDIDLDADLRDVKWALRKFVNKGALNRQLKKVTKVKGRVRGRLMMGDDERDFDTFLEVSSVQGELFYQEFGWPVRIDGGKVDYAHDTLKWKDLRGKAGGHRVESFAGEFSWKDQDRLVIQGFSGTLKAADLLRDSTRFPAVAKLRDELALRTAGSIRVQKLKAEIILDALSMARYAVSFQPSALEIQTNLLPGPLNMKSGSFSLDERSFKGRKCRADLAGSALYARFSLRHHRFQDWLGSLEFTGGVNHKVASWVERHGWVPRDYLPRLPVYLKKLKIVLSQGDHQHVSGELKWKKAGSRADVDIDIGPEFLDIRKIHVVSGGREGTFHMLFDQGGNRRFTLGWKGDITADVRDTCLRKNVLLKGRLSGDFFMDYSAGESSRFRSCRGEIHAQGLTWSWGVNKPLSLEKLDILVRDDNVLLNGEIGLFQDRVDFSGDITLSENKVTAYLDLYANRLSDSSLRLFLGHEEEGPAPGGEKDSPAVKKGEKRVSSSLLSDWNLDIGGEISFAFDTVEFDLGSRLEVMGAATRERIVNVEGANGFGRFELGKFRDVRIFARSFCGLFLRASVKIDPVGGQHRTLTLGTPKDRDAPFEDFLACTGFSKTVISGPFSALMELTSTDGIPDSVGTLRLKAKDGNIRRFGLLSRILGVVNLVDLFSTEPGASLMEGGFPYDKIILKSRIDKGVIQIDHAVIKGRGLNLYGTGTVDLRDGALDLIVFVAPLKTVDKIITSVPIIGAIIGGEHKSLITIPVKVSGPWDAPNISTMPAKAVGDVFQKLLFNVIKAPFSVFSRTGSGGQKKSGDK